MKKRLLVIAVFVLLLEIFVFNGKALKPGEVQYVVNLAQASTSNDAAVFISQDEIRFSGDGSVVFRVPEGERTVMQVEYETTDNAILTGLEMKDGNFAKEFRRVEEKKLMYGSKTEKKRVAQYSVMPYDGCTELKFTVADLDEGELLIKKVTFLTAAPFSFSFVRYAVIFCFCAAVCIIRQRQLYRVVYRRESKRQRLFLALTLTALVWAVVAGFFVPNQEMITYTAGNVLFEDPFIQMFDALYNKKVTLSLWADERLEELDNPYDWSERIAEGVNAEWDRAYYEGAYYSYFGIAPVLLFYVPVYALTGKLPTLNMAAVWFSVWSVVFLFFMLLEFVRTFVRRPNFLLMWLGLIAASLTSGIYMSVNFSNMYILPGIAGNAFVFACIWLGLRGYNEQEMRKQKIAFVLSGVMFVLSVASRPTKALSALVLAPVFIHILCRKNDSVNNKVLCAVSFLIPVAIGAGALMWYNNIRFDSPFDFGQTYQLTVSDIHANRLSLRLLPYAVMKYFFQKPDMVSYFPYMDFGTHEMYATGKYIYYSYNIGALAFPSLAAGLLLLPFVCNRKWRGCRRERVFVRNMTYILMFVIAMVVAWLDFCVGGAILNYVFDILPVLSMLAMLVLLDVHQMMKPYQFVANRGLAVLSGVLLVTVIVSLLYMLIVPLGADFALYQAHPDILSDLERLIVFWK